LFLEICNQFVSSHFLPLSSHIFKLFFFKLYHYINFKTIYIMKTKTLLSTALSAAFLLFKSEASAQTIGSYYTVPPCVTSIVVNVVGAQGGSGKQATGPLAYGGHGGRVQATISVIPGEVLALYFGDQGYMTNGSASTNYSYGGGGGINLQYSDGNIFAGTGGGCSQIRRSPYSTAEILVVAGGGGGASPYNYGGHGGGLIAQAGWSGFPSGASQPGTQSAGGAPTQLCGDGIPTAGSALYGGNGSSSTTSSNQGGGGGSGYYGGGGGTCGDGGSGGSSYTIPGSINVIHTNGYNNAGNGYINITPITTLAAPSTITGITTMCANSIANNYSVTPVAGATSYSWTVPAGANITSGQGTNSITVTFGSTGSQISVIASNSCTSSSATTKTIIVNPEPIITVNSGAICSGQSFTMMPSGANTYTYTSTIAVVSPTTNTFYYVTGTSSQGCVGSGFAISNVTVNALPTIVVNSGAICTGNSFTMTPSGATTYTFSNGSNVASPTANANYNVIGTNANGCVSATGAVSSVTVNALPTINVTSNNSLICIGQSANLTASGATSYTWNTSSNLTTIAVTPTTTTTYTLMGTDANGCQGSNTITQAVSLCTDINSQLVTPSSQFVIYPNPTNEIINVDLEMIDGVSTSASITNALGQVMLNETINTQHSSFNIQYFANGIYYLKVQNGNATQVIKVVKQ
jgi:PKD-like domain/Glycine rich protein/Secretion system C-terminal sorting domain